MQVIVNGTAYTCDKAIKGADYIRLVRNGCEAELFAGISDFSGYVMDGGTWEEPEPTTNDQIDANAAAIAELAEIIAGGGA